MTLTLLKDEILCVYMANAVSLKLPTFWTSSPEVWFSQTEAQFALRGITEDATKFYYVVAALDQDTASLVMDVLQAPPAQGKYESLKKRLSSVFSMDDYERASRLLHLSGLGEDKPSTLMAKMKALLGSADMGILFRQIFLEQMPENIRSHLVSAKEKDLSKLVDQADRIWLATLDSSSVSQVVQGESVDSLSPISFQKTKKTLKPVEKRMVNKEDRSLLCFYHYRFGNKATKCRSPCSMNSGNAKAGRPE